MAADNSLRYDTVVVGGGAAGVAAAIGATQAGASVLLIERNPYFGGQATHCTLPSYCGFFTQSDPAEQIVAGVGQVVLQTLQQLGFYDGPKRTPHTGTSIVAIDAEATKYALDKCLAAAKVDCLLHTYMTDVQVEAGIVKSIRCHDDKGSFIVTAQSFVDASGEANLVAKAGGLLRSGDEQGNLQSATLMFRIGGVPAEADAHPLKVQLAVQQGKAAGITALSKELGTIIRMPGTSGDVLAILADEDTDGLSSHSLTKCEISGRQQAWAYLAAFKNFLPGFEKAYLVSTGPSIGIRETRHSIGEYTITQADVLEARRFPDAIAKGGWPVELHTEPGKPNVWKAVKDGSYYEIPLGCLKVKNLKNVWTAGRIISCDSIAFASLRVMGTGFATGHAAGVVAALQAQGNTYDVESVHKELLRQGANL